MGICWHYPLVSVRRKWYAEDRGAAIVLNRIVKYVFPILIVTILVGFRDNVGVDYPVYKDIYEFQLSDRWQESFQHTEVESVFTGLCVILHILHVPYYGMFVLMAFIPLCFYYASFRHFPYLFVAASFFLFASGVFFWYMNILRQGIVFFIFLFAVRYIIEKSFFRYCFWILVAAGFHISAFLLLPLYGLYYFRFLLLPRPAAWLLYMVTWLGSERLISVLFNLATPFLEGKYVRYMHVLENWTMSGGTGLGVLSLHVADLAILFLSPMCYPFFKKQRFDIYYNIFFIGVLFSNIAGLNMILSRVPFCLVSMRIMVAAFIVYYACKKWVALTVLQKNGVGILLVCNLLYLAGNVLNLEYSFVSL